MNDQNMKNQDMEQIGKQLFDLAVKVRENALAPYTHYKVGCAIMADDGTIFQGVNVESYVCQASICSEGAALYSMLSAGKRKVKAVGVCTQSSPPGPPCGICRQMLIEYADKSTPVFYGNIHGELKRATLGELLPETYVLEYTTEYSKPSD